MTLDTLQTLIDLLAFRADVSAERQAFTFKGIPFTFRELWRGINRFANFLSAQKLQSQECVLVVLPNSAEFFYAFYGIQRAGGIAVPVFPGSGVERILSIAHHCGARMIVLPHKFRDEVKRSASHVGLNLVAVEDSSAYTDDFSSPPKIQLDDIAFLQYTSGSTGNPKGVMLTQANLMTNIRQLIAGMEITENEIFVSWLPVYHDMGLILKTMVPFYLAAQTHLLPTDLRDVRPWMMAIQSHRATFTAAPDFAYRLVLSRVSSGEYDLSSLRVALNAAEPVRASTIREFESRFGLKDVMTAGYGLAEATVGVSMSKPGRSPSVDERGIVSVGRPFPGVDVKIQDDEIFIRTAARCKGYFNNPEETGRLFHGEYLASGDLGYVDEAGEMYITGRKKNIIKHLGQTFAAQELEEIMDGLRDVRFSAAVGIDRGRVEGEQVYLFAELRKLGTVEEYEEIILQAVDAIHTRLGIRPARIVLLKRHGIPRTYNGKVQHNLLKEKFLTGALKKEGWVLYPEY